MTELATPNTPCENPVPFGGPNGHPNYRENQEGARHKGGYVCATQCCCYCGKKAFNAKRYAYLVDGGSFDREEDGDGDHDVGFYPLGSDCAAKLRKVGTPVYKTPAPYGQPGFAPTLWAARKKAS